MKLILSLVMAVLIGLFTIPAGAQEDMDDGIGLKNQVKWLSPFKFMRIEDDSSRTYRMEGNLELYDYGDDSDADFRAQFELPDGAKIVSAEWYVYDECDNDADDDLFDDDIEVELRRVQPDCSDRPDSDLICRAQTRDDPEYVCLDCDFVTTNGIQNVNNDDYYYLAIIRFDTDSSCSDDDQRLIGLKITYRLQVKNYNGADLFDDIANSGFRNYINNLARAGVVSGCGGNSYCPQHTITRGEMAKIVMRAIGGYF